MYRKSWMSCLLVFLVLFVSAQNTFKIETGAILRTTGGVVITLLDMDLENDGTISQAPGEGIFRFAGSLNNTISGNSAPLFDVFEIAKTGTAKVSLQRGIEIGSAVNFTSGLIDLNNNNISMRPTALLNGETETCRIIGPLGGYIEIRNELNAPASADPGQLGAIITSAANLGSTTIRRGHVSQANAGGTSGSIFRYYDIEPANNTALNASLRFRYFDAELNGLNESTIVMWKSTDLVSWTNQGFSSRDIAGNYVEKTGVADFSWWTLSALNNALPVQFLLFNVRCEVNANRVLVNWKTAQEMNASHFEIQRSENGTRWTTVGTVPAAGNSNTDQHYAFTDNSPMANGAVYRIAEFDIDGQVQYTSIIRVECGKPDSWKVWPNPVHEQLFVNIGVVAGSTAIIRVLDSKGSLVRLQRNILLAGSNQVNVDMLRLPAGTYHVVVEWENGQAQKVVKVIKE